MKKRWWTAVFVTGLSVTAPVLAHDDYPPRGADWRAAGALRGGNPDLDRNGYVGPRDVGRMRFEARREARRREEIRRHFAARARAKQRMYHRARAHGYTAAARHAAAHAHAEAARAHAW